MYDSDCKLTVKTPDNGHRWLALSWRATGFAACVAATKPALHGTVDNSLLLNMGFHTCKIRWLPAVAQTMLQLSTQLLLRREPGCEGAVCGTADSLRRCM